MIRFIRWGRDTRQKISRGKLSSFRMGFAASRDARGARTSEIYELFTQ